jgi:AraC-like DNA-binding protein
LLGAAFGKQARLSGNARAAMRAAAFSEVRRYIRANVHQASLTADSLLATLNISRASLYRMFEHEGGIVAYIRKCRLREAADELVRYPQMAVMDIAYGLGFRNGSDFTRAFRRLYGMTPQDFRMQAQRYRSMSGENDAPFPAPAMD